jgi:hypothetical protein
VYVAAKPVAAGGVAAINGVNVAWLACSDAIDTPQGAAAVARLVVKCHREFAEDFPGEAIECCVFPGRPAADGMVAKLGYTRHEDYEGSTATKWLWQGQQ